MSLLATIPPPLPIGSGHFRIAQTGHYTFAATPVVNTCQGKAFMLLVKGISGQRCSGGAIEAQLPLNGAAGCEQERAHQQPQAMSGRVLRAHPSDAGGAHRAAGTAGPRGAFLDECVRALPAVGEGRGSGRNGDVPCGRFAASNRGAAPGLLASGNILSEGPSAVQLPISGMLAELARCAAAGLAAYGRTALRRLLLDSA